MSINSDAADLLESAGFVIGTGHHAKGCFARDANGNPVCEYSDEACFWDVTGAMTEAELTLGSSIKSACLADQTLHDVIGGGCIADWNDAPERTPAEVEAAMLKAAAKLRGEA